MALIDWVKLKKALFGDIKKVILNTTLFILGCVNAFYGFYKYQGEKARADANVEIVREQAKELREKDIIISEVMVETTTNCYDINDVPFPMGYKIYDIETKILRMGRVNPPYENKYSVSNFRYYGKRDSVIDPENGLEWYGNDLKVLEGPPMTPKRVFENSNQGIESWRKWWVQKNDELIYLYFLEL